MTMKRGDAAMVQLRPFAEFKDFMRRLMKVSKAEIDQADAAHSKKRKASAKRK
jgi:hypothetical protein